MVKDADGTERFENTHSQAMHFQDGSMEADLPMQQLSEMFNINHFIVSQAVSQSRIYNGMFKRLITVPMKLTCVVNATTESTCYHVCGI